MYVHINICTVSVQAYKYRTLHVLDKTIDGEARLCVLRMFYMYYEF
jgi:hypothetical protein